MLFWTCGGKQYYAGQSDRVSRHPLRRPAHKQASGTLSDLGIYEVA